MLKVKTCSQNVQSVISVLALLNAIRWAPCHRCINCRFKNNTRMNVEGRQSVPLPRISAVICNKKSAVLNV